MISPLEGADAVPSAGHSSPRSRSVMRAFTAERRDRWPAGAVFLLLVCALAAPSEARAGCSHYVISVAAREHLGGVLDPSLLGEPERESAEPAPAPGRPRPCTGPSCSGTPAPA